MEVIKTINTAKAPTRRVSRAAAILASAVLALGPGPAFADKNDGPGASEMIADVAIARPLGFAMTTLGAVAFVVSLPFSALGGTVKESAEQLVLEPGKSVFVRCLGCKNIADKINE